MECVADLSDRARIKAAVAMFTDCPTVSFPLLYQNPRPEKVVDVAFWKSAQRPTRDCGPRHQLSAIAPRASFVHGNFVATILLCQGLAEHLLAAYLHAGVLVDNIPERIQFADTLRRCRERDVISDQDVTDLRHMMELRNPLSHFRHVDDGNNLDRRTIDTGVSAEELLRRDAIFSIGLVVTILAKPAFRLG